MVLAQSMLGFPLLVSDFGGGMENGKMEMDKEEI